VIIVAGDHAGGDVLFTVFVDIENGLAILWKKLFPARLINRGW
jgi:hypothetical protein